MDIGAVANEIAHENGWQTVGRGGANVNQSMPVSPQTSEYSMIIQALSNISNSLGSIMGKGSGKGVGKGGPGEKGAGRKPQAQWTGKGNPPQQHDLLELRQDRTHRPQL